jgi:hypothetical protein
VLANAEEKETLVIELGVQIKPTPKSTTLAKVEKNFQDMKAFDASTCSAT